MARYPWYSTAFGTQKDYKTSTVRGREQKNAVSKNNKITFVARDTSIKSLTQLALCDF